MKDPFREFKAFIWAENRNQEKVFQPHRHDGFEIIYFVRGSSAEMSTDRWFTKKNQIHGLTQFTRNLL